MHFTSAKNQLQRQNPFVRIQVWTQTQNTGGSKGPCLFFAREKTRKKARKLATLEKTHKTTWRQADGTCSL